MAARRSTPGRCAPRRTRPSPAAGARGGRARGRPACGPPRAARSRPAAARNSLASAWASSPSPSSSWIALSCWRRKYSRWPFSSSDWTWDWILVPIATTSSSRARISERRRSRLATSSSSSSACFSSVGSRSAPAIRWREHRRVIDVGDHHLELLGQVRDLPDDRGERLLDVAHQRGQLGAALDDVGGLGDLGHQVGLGLGPVR